MASYEDAAVPEFGLDDLSPRGVFSAWGLAPSAKSAIRLGFPSSSGAVSRQVAQGAGRMWFVQGGAPFRPRLIASPLVELSWWSVGFMVVRTCNNYIIIYYIYSYIDGIINQRSTYKLTTWGPCIVGFAHQPIPVVKTTCHTLAVHHQQLGFNLHKWRVWPRTWVKHHHKWGGIHEKMRKPLGLPIYNADLQGFYTILYQYTI